MEADTDERAEIDKLVREHGMWGEHPKFSHASWVQQVSNRQTLLGYWHWVVRMMMARSNV